MNNWGQVGVFDLETTGVDVETARIVSACVAILDPDGTVISRWDWLADPGIEIPAGASAIHGITTERAQLLGRTARDVVSEIAQSLRVLFALGVPLVVYNAPYDLTLLDRECRRHAVKPVDVPSPVIDPLVLDKAVDKYRKGKRTLEITAAHYNVALDDAHDAGADAIAAGRVAQALGAAYPDELDVPLADLHARQTVWYADQAASFADYIRRVKGDQDFIADTSWPVRKSEHPTSILDTQPIDAPSPRPSFRVPHLDFDTGVLVLDRPALEASPVRATQRVSEIDAITFDDSQRDAVDVSADDAPVDNTPTGYTVESDSAQVATDAVVDGEAHDTELSAIIPSGYEADRPGELAPFGLSLVEDSDIAGSPTRNGGEASSKVFDLDFIDSGPVFDLDGDDAPNEPSDPVLTGPPVERAAPVRPALRPTVLRVAAAIITDPAGRTLLVRKQGSSIFMQAGGKIERGESAVDALTRELLEELGLELDLGETEYLGSFRAEAANEPDTVIRAEVFALMTTHEFSAQGEIEELVWIETDEPDGIDLAPLTRETILPMWITRRATRY